MALLWGHNLLPWKHYGAQVTDGASMEALNCTRRSFQATANAVARGSEPKAPDKSNMQSRDLESPLKISRNWKTISRRDILFGMVDRIRWPNVSYLPLATFFFSTETPVYWRWRRKESATWAPWREVVPAEAPAARPWCPGTECHRGKGVPGFRISLLAPVAHTKRKGDE